MITVELTEPKTRQSEGRETIRLPFGLLGFEHVKEYVLLANPAEEPFMWFQMLDDTKRAFSGRATLPPGGRLSAGHQR